MEPLICDIPYPSTDGLEKDLRSGQILSFAYATPRGEISAVLQYCYHAIYIKKHNEKDAEILKSIAAAEAKHCRILGEALEKLGIDPVYTQLPNTQKWYDASCVSRSTTPQKMIMDDIGSELNSIAEFNKMLFVLKNEQVAAIVQRLILDEQLHMEALKQMLERYSVANKK